MSNDRLGSWNDHQFKIFILVEGGQGVLSNIYKRHLKNDMPNL